jgi:hypothetical protein
MTITSGPQPLAESCDYGRRSIRPVPKGEPKLKRLPTTLVSSPSRDSPGVLSQQVFHPFTLKSPNVSDETVAALLGAKMHMQRGMAVDGAKQPNCLLRTTHICEDERTEGDLNRL